MQTETILLLIAAAIIALIIALFQYMYRSKNRSVKVLAFTFLRFVSIFSVLVLLINPKFRQLQVYTEKPVLNILVDNSSSIQHLKQGQKVIDIINTLKSDAKIQERFDLQEYTFSDELRDTLILNFEGKQTTIAQSLDDVSEINRKTVAPIVLITDGNQTYGTDYSFSSKKVKQQVFPLVVGDTTSYNDVRIQQLNVNRYAYLKNKFPVEAILIYDGNEEVDTKFEIKSGSATLHSQQISFSKENNSKVVNITLPASTPGVLKYQAIIQPLQNEKNTINNKKNFAVEVIDQKTNVAIVSDIVHPDIGAIKKSIESNERRSVSILKPTKLKNIDDYQLVILYQPNTRFTAVYEKLKTARKNYFTVTGKSVDWNFLNKIQSNYNHEITRQSENYLADFNTNYGMYLVEDIGFENYPPLQGTFGELKMNTANDILLSQKIGNLSTESPLLTTMEFDGVREAVLFGEGIWRWRAQSYLDYKSFETFDDFMGKLIQYLASNKKKSRLTVSSESFYYGNSSIKIQAEYFTKNYEFDSRGNLSIVVKNKENNNTREIPMLIKNNVYEVDLSNLPSGTYDFTVKVKGESNVRSGNFTILDFDVEQQFLNADVTKLQKVATNTNGSLFFANQQQQLIDSLIQDERYRTIQKSKENVVSLIDWKYLLAIIIIALAIEWFMRKYNGLI